MASPEVNALIQKMKSPPPPGSPYGVPIPGSQKENRTPVYRQWRYRDSPMLENLEPSLQTVHDLFESAVAIRGSKPAIGWRVWDSTTRTHENKYTWMTYNELAEKRKLLGAGIVEIHHRLGVTADKYGVGIWSPNRPEWHMTGKSASSLCSGPVR
jgi:long-chain acyl-CoA synthetase